MPNQPAVQPPSILSPATLVRAGLATTAVLGVQAGCVAGFAASVATIHDTGEDFSGLGQALAYLACWTLAALIATAVLTWGCLRRAGGQRRGGRAAGFALLVPLAEVATAMLAGRLGLPTIGTLAAIVLVVLATFSAGYRPSDVPSASLGQAPYPRSSDQFRAR